MMSGLWLAGVKGKNEEEMREKRKKEAVEEKIDGERNIFF